jgi:hyperosmotically inducible protein
MEIKTMKNPLAISFFLLGTILAPVVAFADSDADRSQPMTFVKDSAITTEIKAKLAADKMSSLVNVQVDTDSAGAVVLSGKTKTQAEADKAYSIARGTEGVKSVTSKIQVGN